MKKIKEKFEDRIQDIDREIAKRRSRWQLKAITWMDFEDVSQIIRIHIHKKWKMWNQERDLLPWLNRVISHQIRNIVRNVYSNFSRPCLRCSANQGDDLCSLYHKQCNACPLYAKWEKTRKRAHDIKLPLSIENHQQEVSSTHDERLDVEKAAKILHERMKGVLRPVEWRVYEALYIEHKTEEAVADEMGYRTSETGRMKGYKRIKLIKNTILARAKEILKNDGIEAPLT